ncbi:hypothetical protein A2165_01850 [Candidatus Curtissbacteria bacterium RBG_13_40_7]|uniref:DOT1 domain-containing protein n=1 Tax=Candidatus Curtissbacteria bacterium RBG_13_40_7 TaxID=1797706 RepID=A0A1F5FWR9_9BACT|nr:MAG: hypothetical protein A2165_01850 [Candidatus Curtissbacteria bacterium RBG_13_40_7]
MLVLLIFFLFIFFLLLFILFFVTFFAIDLIMDLPFVGTKKEKIETILKLANVKKGETVIDLGSGDGRLLFAAAQKGANAIGYELNPFLVLLTQIKIHIKDYSSSEVEKYKNRGTFPQGRTIKGLITIKRQNFWKADLSQADVIFVYAFRKTMQKFQDFIYKKAKKGTRIIVNTNPFPNKKPLKIQNGIFLYRV